jgi:hypothetical protein
MSGDETFSGVTKILRTRTYVRNSGIPRLRAKATTANERHASENEQRDALIARSRGVTLDMPTVRKRQAKSVSPHRSRLVPTAPPIDHTLETPGTFTRRRKLPSLNDSETPVKPPTPSSENVSEIHTTMTDHDILDRQVQLENARADEQRRREQAEASAKALRDEAERQRREWQAVEQVWREERHVTENHYADLERRVGDTLEAAQKRAREAEDELARVHEALTERLGNHTATIVSDTIIAPKPFTGKGWDVDGEDWLNYFERYADHRNLNDAQKIVHI